ncbi:hypothetical protein OG205_25035 [Lentzea sp. NBC_00516]|uniref:hypothetical protein n=1 Tax=Lentzea sp. NBC_00516 TaxID=2903582 RepID=UPI002E81354B|nr:hypothetical protein [Lentzea sp. NBC_00516]WUD21398.1 hypothetical protein OG205_25035 [Lentzea sp. NBC_00516]
MKSTCSTVLRRTLGVAGFLIGFGLLSAGVASADDGDSPGLLGGVAELVAPVTEPVLAPLTPVVDTAVRTLSPVLEPLQPVTAPLLAPVVNTVRDVPVVPRIAEPLVAQPSAPAEVPPPVAVPETPPVPAVALTANAVTTSGVVPVPVPVAKAPQQISAPDVAPPIEAPSSPSPDVPLVLPGTTGSVSSNGSTGLALSDLPAGSGIRPGVESLAVVTDHQIHGSWCYYYGRSHPS